MSDTNGSSHTLPNALMHEFALLEATSRRVDAIDKRLDKMDLEKLGSIPDLILRLLGKIEENSAMQRASTQATERHGSMLENHGRLLEATVDTVSKAVTLLSELVEQKPTAEQIAKRRRK